MIFQSAVDWWFYLVVGVIAGILAIAILPPAMSGELSLLAAVSIVALGLGLPVWLLNATYYEVRSDTLVVKSGPFVWRIKRAEIQSARPSKSILSAPALSLNRIEIRYGDDQSILVSARDQQGFTNAIALSGDGA